MEITVFENKQFGTLRTVERDGEMWFVGKDVAEKLGYSNPRKAIGDHVDEEDKTDGVTIRDSIGRDQQPIIINESGLYSLVLSSKLPTAKEFKHWVTSEVLPSVRKHGVYAVDDLLENPDVMIAVLNELKVERDKRRALQDTVAVQHQQIAELQPKATYYDRILGCKDALTATVIAKDYGWSGQQLNEYLHRKGVQFKQGETWLLYQRHAGNGYTRTETKTFSGNDGVNHVRVMTKWTQKGRLFIYDLLKRDGVLPEVER